MNLRAVRSFVRRAGRMTDAQQRALHELWPRYGVPGETGLIDFAVLFGRSAPNTIEIGFGNGDHLAARALAEPQRNFLGVEVHRPGIGHLLRAAAAANLANLRVMEHDAVEVLHSRIAPEALDEIQILFPDPWPKKRHHKRRLIQPDFAILVASRLRRGAGGCTWRPTGRRTRSTCASFSTPARHWRHRHRTPATASPHAPRPASSGAGCASGTPCVTWSTNAPTDAAHHAKSFAIALDPHRSRAQHRRGGHTMNMQQPGIGEWYRLSSGELLEVVAFDAADGTIEVQYFDGTVEEFDFDDWPEDWSGSVDVEPEDGRADRDPNDEEDRRLRADRLEGLDLFE
jgi:tRNA G46 methylase TrmB